jgi:small subunit ribosomal protein S20
VANHKSAFKRARQSEIKRLRNKTVKTRIKSVIKEVRQTAGNASSEQSLTTLNMAKSTIGKAVKKGIIHKRTAARKISRLSKLTNKASL